MGGAAQNRGRGQQCFIDGGRLEWSSFTQCAMPTDEIGNGSNEEPMQLMLLCWFKNRACRSAQFWQPMWHKYRAECLVCLMSNHRSQSLGGGLQMSIERQWEAPIACRPPQFVYTWSTLGLHMVYMFKTCKINCKNKHLVAKRHCKRTRNNQMQAGCRFF